MWRFYWNLLRKSPDEARVTWARIVFWVGITIAVVLFFNPEAGRKIDQAWTGTSRVWAVVPVLGLGVLRILRRNYEEFEMLRKQIETEDQTKQTRRNVRERLSYLITECKFSENKCFKKADPASLSIQVEKVFSDATKFLETLSDQSFANLFLMATENDCHLDDHEMRRHDMLDDQYMKWLRLLRAKRSVLESCLTHFPPLS